MMAGVAVHCTQLFWSPPAFRQVMARMKDETAYSLSIVTPLSIHGPRIEHVLIVLNFGR